MKKSHVFRVLCAMLAVFALAAALPAQAAQSEKSGSAALIYPAGFGRTRLAMMEDGTFAKAKLSRAKVGGKERFAVSLMCSELAAAGEQAVVSVSSKGYDFSKCEPVLLIPVDDVYYARKLTDFEADEHSLSAVVRVEYLGVNKDSPVFLYFAPKKTAEEPEVSLNVSRKTEERFDFGQSIVIGDYSINKQGGIMPVEVALGMANMDGEDTVYLISDALGKEVLRLVIHEGELYGIAIKDNGIVVSLEYNFAKKAYVSVISGKSLVKKETVVEIFRQLGISFANPPDEEKWLANQTVYSTDRKIRIVEKAVHPGG